MSNKRKHAVETVSDTETGPFRKMSAFEAISTNYFYSSNINMPSSDCEQLLTGITRDDNRSDDQMEAQKSSACCVDSSQCQSQHCDLNMVDSEPIVCISEPYGDDSEQIIRTSCEAQEILKYLTSTNEFEKWPEIRKPESQFVHLGSAQSLLQCDDSQPEVYATSPASNQLQVTSSSVSESRDIVQWIAAKRKTDFLALEKIIQPYLQLIQVGSNHWELLPSQEPFLADPEIGMTENSAPTCNELNTDRHYQLAEYQLYANNKGTDLRFKGCDGTNVNETGWESSRTNIDSTKNNEIVSDIVEVSSQVTMIPLHGDESYRKENSFDHSNWKDLKNQTIMMENPYSSLYDIMSENKQIGDLKIVFSKEGPSKYCKILINNCEVAKASGQNLKKAKKSAALEALTNLKKICWTIQRKIDWREVYLVCKSCFVGVFKECRNLESNNLGCKMLMRMGWNGGETVAHSMMNQGLGLFSGKLWRNDIQKFLKFFSASENCDDIVFSDEFTPNDIKIIQEESHSYKNVKFEKDVFLLRNRSAADLLDHLKGNNGESCLYKLYPPGCHRETLMDDFSMKPFNSVTIDYTTLSQSLGEFKARIAHIFEMFTNSMKLKFIRFTQNLSVEEKKAVMELAEKSGLSVTSVNEKRLTYLMVSSKIAMQKRKCRPS